jgi:hypothetical protein
MLKYRNFGRKSLQELVDILSDMGLHFGMDVESLMLPGGDLGEDAPEAEGEEAEVEEVAGDAETSGGEPDGDSSDEDEESPGEDEIDDDDAL